MGFYLIGFVPKLRSKGLHIRVSILVKQTPSKGQGHSSEGSFRGVAYVLGRCSRDWHFGYTLEVLKSLTLATVPTAHTNSHIAPDLLRRATCRIPPIVGNSTGLLLRPILAEAVLSNSPQGSFEKA